MLKPWLPKSEVSDFTPLLLEWFVLNGRTNLPWQNPRTPYAVWISEIMLQQTQVKTVIPYFLRFMARFPDIQTLAQAPEDDVLAHWSGLGYYSRGRRLHQTAQRLLNDFDATLPMDLKTLMSLPGIGASTAAAIASLAYNQPTAILDGNVKRVLSRFFMVEGDPQKASTHKTLKTWADLCMPSFQCADYTQAIMDLGATVCTPKSPTCHTCPLQQGCKAHQHELTEHYPQKAVKKTLPHKTQLFPLIHTEDQKIYLEKRPSKGLWGGLWCLPWLEIDACA
ncbi:MAG: A/G-specific adenine glycosylase, partial [Legionellaceae bacterium]